MPIGRGAFGAASGPERQSNVTLVASLTGRPTSNAETPRVEPPHRTPADAHAGLACSDGPSSALATLADAVTVPAPSGRWHDSGRVSGGVNPISFAVPGDGEQSAVRDHPLVNPMPLPPQYLPYWSYLPPPGRDGDTEPGGAPSGPGYGLPWQSPPLMMDLQSLQHAGGGHPLGPFGYPGVDPTALSNAMLSMAAQYMLPPLPMAGPAPGRPFAWPGSNGLFPALGAPPLPTSTSSGRGNVKLSYSMAGNGAEALGVGRHAVAVPAPTTSGRHRRPADRGGREAAVALPTPPSASPVVTPGEEEGQDDGGGAAAAVSGAAAVPLGKPDCVRLPSGKRVYLCRHCEFQSAMRRSVVSHERVHSDERPFQCSHCPYRAKRRFEITVHERTHTNERPLACPHCEMRFKAHGSLRWHLDHAHTPTGRPRGGNAKASGGGGGAAQRVQRGGSSGSNVVQVSLSGSGDGVAGYQQWVAPPRHAAASTRAGSSGGEEEEDEDDVADAIATELEQRRAQPQLQPQQHQRLAQHAAVAPASQAPVPTPAAALSERRAAGRAAGQASDSDSEYTAAP